MNMVSSNIIKQLNKLKAKLNAKPLYKLQMPYRIIIASNWLVYIQIPINPIISNLQPTNFNGIR